MWIRHSHYEHLFGALSAARERILQLERMEAGHTATIEWMRVHVNRLETERGILTTERLHVVLPVPSIEREAPPHPRSDETPQGQIVQGLPVDPIAGTVPDDAIGVAQLLGSLMEDLGDDAAGRMGIKHDGDGHVVYTERERH